MVIKIENTNPISKIAEVDALVRGFCEAKDGCCIETSTHIHDAQCYALVYGIRGVTEEEVLAAIRPPAPAVCTLSGAVASSSRDPRPANYLAVGPGFSIYEYDAEIGKVWHDDPDFGPWPTKKLGELVIEGDRYIVRDASAVPDETWKTHCLEIVELLKMFGVDSDPNLTQGAIMLHPVVDRGRESAFRIKDYVKDAIFSIMRRNRCDITIVQHSIEYKTFFDCQMHRLWNIQPSFKQLLTKEEMHEALAEGKGTSAGSVFDQEFVEELQNAGFALNYCWVWPFPKLIGDIFTVLQAKSYKECLQFWGAVSCRVEDAIRNTTIELRGQAESIRSTLILLEAVGYNPLFGEKYENEAQMEPTG